MKQLDEPEQVSEEPSTPPVVDEESDDIPVVAYPEFEGLVRS